MKTKVTQSSLSSILKGIPSGKPTYVWDTELSGFGLYVSSKGDVSYLVQRWLGGRDGKAQRYVIGRDRDGMDVQEAKRQAVTTIADLLNGNTPPSVRAKDKIRENIERQRQDKEAITTKDALNDYFSKHPAEGRYRVEMEALIRRALKPYDTTQVRKITKADIKSLLEGYEDRPAALRSLFAALRPFFNHCVDKDFIPASPLQTIKAPSPVASRDRTLTRSEIRLYWLASYHPSISSVWGSFFRLLLLTGQRREEVSGMTFEEIDFDQAIWTIPKERAKNKKAHVVHLTPLALQEINSTPGANERKGFVFPAARLRVAKDEAHISGYSKMKSRLDAVMEAIGNALKITSTSYRLHDVRRTVASGMAEAGHSPDVIDRLLNHVSGSQSGVKGIYQRYQFLKERQAAIVDWSHTVEKITSDLEEKRDKSFWTTLSMVNLEKISK